MTTETRGDNKVDAEALDVLQSGLERHNQAMTRKKLYDRIQGDIVANMTVLGLTKLQAVGANDALKSWWK